MNLRKEDPPSPLFVVDREILLSQHDGFYVYTIPGHQEYDSEICDVICSDEHAASNLQVVHRIKNTPKLVSEGKHAAHTADFAVVTVERKYLDGAIKKPLFIINAVVIDGLHDPFDKDDLPHDARASQALIKAVQSDCFREKITSQRISLLCDAFNPRDENLIIYEPNQPFVVINRDHQPVNVKEVCKESVLSWISEVLLPLRRDDDPIHRYNGVYAVVHATYDPNEQITRWFSLQSADVELFVSKNSNLRRKVLREDEKGIKRLWVDTNVSADIALKNLGGFSVDSSENLKRLYEAKIGRVYDGVFGPPGPLTLAMGCSRGPLDFYLRTDGYRYRRPGYDDSTEVSLSLNPI